MPPIITSHRTNASTIPLIHFGISKSLNKTKAIELDCVMFPAPRPPNSAAIAKKIPKRLMPKPLLM
jgi:hypothetical protein